MCWDAYCYALWWYVTHCCPASEDIPIPEIPAEVLAEEVAAEALEEFADVITDPHIQVKLTTEERVGMHTVDLD